MIICIEIYRGVSFFLWTTVHTINGETDTIPRGNFDKGGLVYPSKTVVNLLHQLEDIVTENFTSEKLHWDSILDILEMIKETGIIYIGRA